MAEWQASSRSGVGLIYVSTACIYMTCTSVASVGVAMVCLGLYYQGVAYMGVSLICGIALCVHYFQLFRESRTESIVSLDFPLSQ